MPPLLKQLEKLREFLDPGGRNKSYPENPFTSLHPKDAGHVGFVIAVDRVRVYQTGGTDTIPEMKDFRADIALVPVSGKYVMTVDEALEAVKTLDPGLAIPMHVGRGIGTMEDAERFRELSPVPARVLPLP